MLIVFGRHSAGDFASYGTSADNVTASIGAAGKHAAGRNLFWNNPAVRKSPTFMWKEEDIEGDGLEEPGPSSATRSRCSRLERRPTGAAKSRLESPNPPTVAFDWRLHNEDKL